MLHLPMPDYSKIQSKVNTWRRMPKIDGEDKKEVSDVVTCSVVQMEARNLPRIC
jgi:hypothetical protein